LELAPIALQVWDLSQAAGRTVGDLIEAIEFDAWKQRLDTYVVHGSSWFRGLGRFLGFKSVSLRAWDQRADQAILRYQL
jgi:hypothetical protein